MVSTVKFDIAQILGSDIKSSEITPEEVFLKRRQFMRLGAGSALVLANAACAKSDGNSPLEPASSSAAKKLAYTKAPAIYSSDEQLTPEKAATTYNNFYEFGTGKEDPAKLAQGFVTDPWSIKVDGLVDKPATYALEDLIDFNALQERVYRLRCVEAWSMVVPWLGVPLASVLKKVGPSSKAKYVAFETLVDPKRMPGQASNTSFIDWPYREGLRMDEAMHPLTFLAVGLYGKELLPQNGAPVRLVVPWKYGFKSIKSIVRLSFVEQQPPTTWNISAPHEYGFYANVNPEVDHPRWSQKYERRLPSTIFDPNRIATQPFNGYANQVADLYKGMDLSKFI